MPITFPLSPLTIVVEIALGVDPASDPAGWSWTDITSKVRYQPRITITRGRRDESSRVDAATARLTLDNRDGRFCRRNPSGAYYGQLSKNTPIRIGVNPGTGTVYRFHGFVNEWPARWTKDVRDATVPIACAGILRRLLRNRKLDSALYRTIIDSSPVAYWTLDDGTSASSFASAVGGEGMAVHGSVTFGGTSGPDGGGEAVANLSSSTGLTGKIPGGSTTAWAVEACFKVTGNADGGWFILHTANPNLILQVFPTVTPVVSLTVNLFDASIGSSSFTAFPTSGVVLDDGDWHHIAVTAAQSGGNVQVTAYLDGTSTGHSSVGFTLAALREISFNTNDSFAQPWAPGGRSDVAAYDNASVDMAGHYQAMTGYVGEAAHTRMIRVCGEVGVSFTTSATRTAAMGPQPRGTVLDVVRDCETCDQGLLYENQFGLGYLSLDERYNPAVSLALDFNQGDMAEPPEPADDDQQTVNSFTASRSRGSTAPPFEDTDSIDTDGLYASSGTFNVAADSQLEDIASWHVHLGTVDEDRWPAIAIRLARTPVRITNWVALAIGGRMTVANPPDQAAPATIDTIVEGWAESISPHMWEAVLNTSPASVWRTGIVTTAARIDHSASTLNSSATTTATSLSVASTGSLWTTTATFPADFPFDIVIEGERITVTAISGTSSPQTFTVTRSVDGIVKSHGAGAAVRLFTPYYVGL